MRLRFRDCTLDADVRRLVRGNEEAHLPGKAFELLKLLIENYPRALSKAELVEGLWRGVFVADDSLAKVVSQLRKAIGDDDSRSIVRTVHGYGYAFDAAIEVLDRRDGDAVRRPAACWLFFGNREFGLGDGEHIVGRDPDVGVCLDSPSVSRRHARIVVDGTRATLDDLESKNGSFVGGVRVCGPTPLISGDEVRIGTVTLQFKVAEDSGSTVTLA